MKCLVTHSGSTREKAVNYEDLNCLARLLQRELPACRARRCKNFPNNHHNDNSVSENDEIYCFTSGYRTLGVYNQDLGVHNRTLGVCNRTVI
jgi:hypothetical protein